MQAMEVITLAGGRGARMGPDYVDKQKCLAIVEDKPVIGHLMDNLVAAFGSISIKIGVCHRPDDVVDYVTHNKPPNVIVDFFRCKEGEGETGYFRRVKPLMHGRFVTAPGDIVALPSVYQNAANLYDREQIDGVISTSPRLDVIDTHGIARVERDRVVDLQWPPPPVIPEGYHRDMTIWAGDQRFFDLIDAYPNIPRRGMSWVYMEALKEGRPIAGNIYNQHWLHLAYPKDLNSPIPRQ